MADNFMQTKTSSATTVLEPLATQADGLVRFLNENFIAITGVEEIAQFVRSHPGAEATLQESLPVVKGIFGSVKPLLIVSREPYSSEHDGLTALIPAGSDVDTALQNLDAFRDWWYKHEMSDAGVLVFDVKMD